MKLKFSFLLSAGLLIIYLISSTSCNREDYSKQILILDSLKVQATHFQFQLDSIDSISTMNLVPLIEKDIQWIKDSLTKETMKLGTVFLVKVRTANKLTINFPLEYKTLKSEISYSIKQLDDLISDLKKGSIEPTEAHKYVNDEEIAFKIIDSHLAKMLKQLESIKDYPDIRTDFYTKLQTQGSTAK